MIAEFHIPGLPVGKQRPKFARVGNYTRAYTPEKTVNYENYVRLMYQQNCPGIFFDKDIPLEMKLVVWLPIPKSASKKNAELMRLGRIRPTKKPDSSNIQKSIEDGLNGVAYHDDSQIVDSEIHRFYGTTPGVWVLIKPAGEESED